jgi:hypothetical protein
MFDTDSVIPLDQTFPRLPDGNRVFCNEMAPRDEAASALFSAYSSIILSLGLSYQSSTAKKVKSPQN